MKARNFVWFYLILQLLQKRKKHNSCGKYFQKALTNTHWFLLVLDEETACFFHCLQEHFVHFISSNVRFWWTVSSTTIYVYRYLIMKAYNCINEPLRPVSSRTCEQYKGWSSCDSGPSIEDVKLILPDPSVIQAVKTPALAVVLSRLRCL